MADEVRAYQKSIRQTPRKLRLVADLVRGRRLLDAETQLEFVERRAARAVGAVLKQARANALAAGLTEASLMIQRLVVEEGPRLKRWRAVSRGRAHPFVRKMSHLKVIISGKMIASEKKITQAEKNKGDVSSKGSKGSKDRTRKEREGR